MISEQYKIRHTISACYNMMMRDYVVYNLYLVENFLSVAISSLLHSLLLTYFITTKTSLFKAHCEVM